MKPIYLDHAAATPLDPGVLEAMEPYLHADFANPSSIYGAARRSRQAVDQSRALVAKVLGSKPTEIVFTASGSESVNLAIQGTIYLLPHGSHWVTTTTEHDAVLAQCEPLERSGYPSTIVPVKLTGEVDAAKVLEAVTDKTVLVSVQLANNEIGTIQPLGEIAKGVALIRAERTKQDNALPLYLHTDAVAAANYCDLSVARLGIDLLSLSGSKLYGPKGSGLLYVRTGTRLEPRIFGGGQERGRRSGTENVAGIVGFAAALELAYDQRSTEARRLELLRASTIKTLEGQVPDITWNGTAKRQLPGTINMSIPGVEGQALVLYLDKEGIMASTGSACTSGDVEPSHVLLALGRTQVEAAASLRITMGRATNEDQLDHLIQVLPPIIERLRALSPTVE